MQVSGWLSIFLNYEQFALFAVKATVYSSWNRYQIEKQTPNVPYSPQLPLNDKDWAIQMMKSWH